MHKALISLLNQERAAIIVADFNLVDSLAPAKQKLFEKSLAQISSESDLAEIRTALLRNQALFQAAIEGVSSARSRLNALREVRDNLRTYDESGRIAQVTARTPDLSKRS